MSNVSSPAPGMMGDFTARLLNEAGIEAGMRVLDYGCGPGDVSLHLAGLVGEGGQVVGIDRNENSLGVARRRAVDLGHANVAFVRADLDGSDAPAGLFDALIGRRVLMYLPDPLVALRGLMQVLRPGGLVVCQEHDWTMTPAGTVPLPLHEWLHGVIKRTIESEGADTRMGFGLASLLARAGLRVERALAEAVVQVSTSRQSAGPLIRMMLPRIIEGGIATPEEIGIDTLDDRLAQELRDAEATYVGDIAFGVWARKPA